MSSVDARLRDLGIELPPAAAPVANYRPFVRSGAWLHVSGQLPLVEGSLRHAGRLGDGLLLEDGQAAARLCAINILAQVRAALDGDLERVRQLVKLVGFVSSAPSFIDQPKVVNAASDLMVEVLGERGRHARSAVGVAALPLGAAVEVEAIIEVA